jgi:pimeloyl-ACP methyl ester carboxylesterase
MTAVGDGDEDAPMSDTRSDELVADGWHRRGVAVGGMTFDLAEQGPADGRPVVLLHGFPQTHRAYDSLAAFLSRQGAGLRLLAPDQRGYSPGARPADPGAYTLAELAGDVVAILEMLRLGAVDVVGHDWGSLVGWYLAAHHPDRVRTFTAVSVPHPAALASALGASAQQRRMSSYVTLFRDPEKAARVLLEDDARRLRALYRPLDERAIAPHLAALAEPEALTAALNWYRATKLSDGARIPSVDVPVTYVWSTADAAISRSAAERCVEYVTGPYRFVELEGVSHWVPDQAPEALAAALRFPAR